MSFGELILIAVGLSMDAFAVAVCKGLSIRNLKWRDCAIVGLYFGLFQAGMPVIGYYLGNTFAQAVASIDHWIAFVLLGLIGGRMIWESIHGDENECDPSLGVREMTALAVATSLDALAIGVSFAFLGVDILPAAGLIGCITFLMSFCGVRLGKTLGGQFQSKAELGGGIVLVLLGIKILCEHLFS